jgi:N-acetylglucosaminyl-diphospho-decaprenol L-rhamnosyltransferase
VDRAGSQARKAAIALGVTINKRIDVVIVHYPSADDLVRCHEASAALADGPASITIVDNASPERVPAALLSAPGVKVVSEPENLGFSKAANDGASVGDAPFVLFVNPDVVLTTATLETLVDALQEDDVAAAAPRLVLPDGRTQIGCAGWFPTVGTLTTHALQVPSWMPGKWSKRPLFLQEPDPNGTDYGSPPNGQHARVDWVSAACLLMRRDAFESIGGFDESFFMYAEDIDLCLRLRDAGWQVRYCPSASVEHGHLALLSSQSARAPKGTWLTGLDQYYRLHCPGTRRVMHAVFGTGFALRALAYGSRLAEPRSTGDMATRRFAYYARRSFKLAIAP